MSRRALLLIWMVLAAGGVLIPGLIPERAADADLPEQSARTFDYEIDVTLDPELHALTATGTLAWRNDSPVPVTDIQLHMYLNAFKNRFTTFMRESQGSHRGNDFADAHPGSIEITSFKTSDGAELAAQLEYVTPDVGTPLSRGDTTVARIPLPANAAIAPGATGTFTVEWKSVLPRVFARTGHGGDFHMIAQWFPKPGVFEQEASADGTDGPWGWNCHQFHGRSEFYSDYGTYRVRMTVPEDFTLGASGKLQGDPKIEDGQATYEHVAQDVHDFAWVTSDDFVVRTARFEGGSGTSAEEHELVARVLGRDQSEVALDPVDVTFLLQPEHESQFERHRDAVFSALTYLGFWYGNYPYSTLTVVDPDHRGQDAGGMEYPTLITGGTRIIRPRRMLSPEGVLVHEFAHQHFYGLVGTNEFESAWMDEGMTTYATAKALMRAYPPPRPTVRYGKFYRYGVRPVQFAGIAAESKDAMPALSQLFDEHLKMPFGEFDVIDDWAEDLGVGAPPGQISLWVDFGEVGPLSYLREMPSLTLLDIKPPSVAERERGWYASNPIVDPIAGRKAWEHMNGRSYGNNSYRRTSSSLRTLEGMVGEETMIRIMRTYAERYRFKHPKPKDFFDTAKEVAAKDGKVDLDPYIQDLFYSTRSFDFGIESITTQEAPKPTPDAVGEFFESFVTVRRFGEVRMPCDIAIGFGDGEFRKLRWELDDTITSLDDGPVPEVLSPPRGTQQRWVKLFFQGSTKVTVAEVDPYGRFGLDRDRTNDGLREPKKGMVSWQIALKALAWIEMTTSFYGSF